MPNTTVLVVEDDPAVQEVVHFVLREANIPVCTAQNAHEAWTLIRKQPPALILLDWMLPGTSGIELARQLKKNHDTRTIPVVMLTAKGEEEDKLLGFDSGVDDYVTKPFPPGSWWPESRRLRAGAWSGRGRGRRSRSTARFGSIRLPGALRCPENPFSWGQRNFACCIF